MPHRLRPRRARARGPYHRQDPAARPAVRPREGDRMSTTVIPVATPTGGYDVHVGRGLLGQVPALVPERTGRVVIIHQPSLREIAAELREQLISEAGREAFLGEGPEGEEAATALAGFVAASWLRGVDVLQVPTTVAAMVDAAVGGKTGINTPEGKNLVGAFHPPIAVVADLDVLTALGANDVAAGLAEVVK